MPFSTTEWILGLVAVAIFCGFDAFPEFGPRTVGFVLAVGFVAAALVTIRVFA